MLLRLTLSLRLRKLRFVRPLRASMSMIEFPLSQSVNRSGTCSAR